MKWIRISVAVPWRRYNGNVYRRGVRNSINMRVVISETYSAEIATLVTTFRIIASDGKYRKMTNNENGGDDGGDGDNGGKGGGRGGSSGGGGEEI